MVDWLPWSHVFGGNHNFDQVLKNGGTLYIDDGKPIAGRVREVRRATCAKFRPTIYLNVPKGFELLLPYLANDEVLRKTLLRRSRCHVLRGRDTAGSICGRALPKSRAASARDNPPSMISGWGLTETSPAALMLNRHDAEIGNIGPPMPGMEVKLVPQRRQARNPRARPERHARLLAHAGSHAGRRSTRKVISSPATR